MKKHNETKKALTLETETLVRLDRDILGKVFGGNDDGGDDEYEYGGVTAADHSCNPACSPA